MDSSSADECWDKLSGLKVVQSLAQSPAEAVEAIESSVLGKIFGTNLALLHVVYTYLADLEGTREILRGMIARGLGLR